MKVEMTLCKQVSEDFSDYTGVFDEVTVKKNAPRLDFVMVCKINYEEEDIDTKTAVLHFFIINETNGMGMYLVEGSIEKTEEIKTDIAKVDFKDVLLDGEGKYEIVAIRKDDRKDVDSNEGLEVFQSGKEVGKVEFTVRIEE